MRSALASTTGESNDWMKAPTSGRSRARGWRSRWLADIDDPAFGATLRPAASSSVTSGVRNLRTRLRQRLPSASEPCSTYRTRCRVRVRSAAARGRRGRHPPCRRRSRSTRTAGQRRRSPAPDDAGVKAWACATTPTAVQVVATHRWRLFHPSGTELPMAIDALLGISSTERQQAAGSSLDPPSAERCC